MKILILGGSGMLGHQLWRHFHGRHETWVTLRGPAECFLRRGLFTSEHVYEGVDAAHGARLTAIVRQLRPDAVLNCIGVIKQLKEAKSAIPSIMLNALLPHQVAAVCRETGTRLIQFSTDCVFSGRRGDYREDDVPDATDLYGRTKLLGEVTDSPHAVTLRTSIIGRELDSRHSLIDWFLSQRGRKIHGYRRAIYTGFTTLEMARIVERILLRHCELTGLWQVASAAISKYDLLRLVRDRFGLEVEIEPDESFACDRSLNGTRFSAATEYVAPSWDAMIEELAADSRAVASFYAKPNTLPPVQG